MKASWNKGLVQWGLNVKYFCILSYQVSIIPDEGKVPDFGDVSGQGLETMLDTQIPELDKGVLRTGNQNIGTALHKSHLKKEN